MDPNETLRQIQLILTEEIDEKCNQIYEWLQKKGFKPDWDKYPEAKNYYNHYLVSKIFGKEE